MQTEWQQGQFKLSCDQNNIDLEATHSFLRSSYWAKDIPFDLMKTSIENSLCFALFDQNNQNRQIGFCRFITDKATFAYLGDVYVLADYRGQGLASWMLKIALTHPDLQLLRRISLVTFDAGPLYQLLGFETADVDAGYMHIRRADIYQTLTLRLNQHAELV